MTDKGGVEEEDWAVGEGGEKHEKIGQGTVLANADSSPLE